MGKLKKKIVLPILGIFVIVCIIGIILWNRQDFHLIKDTLTLEYGETLPNQFDDFIETNGDIEYSSQDIDVKNKISPLKIFSLIAALIITIILVQLYIFQ